MLQFHGNDTKNTKVLLLLLVGILLIVVAVVAGKMLVDSQSADEGKNTNVTPPKKEGVMGLPADNRDTEGLFVLRGFVLTMLNEKGMNGKMIELSVSIPAEKNFGNSSKIVSYRFFLSDKDTKGSSDVKVGQSVVVHFVGNPSETSYVPVKVVEVEK